MLLISPLLLSVTQHSHPERIFQNMSMPEPNATGTRPPFPFPNYTAFDTPSGGCERTHRAPLKTDMNQQEAMLATCAVQRQVSLHSHQH